MYQHYLTGADRAAIDNIYFLRVRDKNPQRVANMTANYHSPTHNIFYGGGFVGGPERVADYFAELATSAALDGIIMTFQDFLQGLRIFGDKVMPLLRARGIDVGRTDAVISA
jgi:pyrimidine oxygenase